MISHTAADSGSAAAIDPFSLEQLANAEYLKSVWKSDVRPLLRQAKFSSSRYAIDPLLYAAYEWNLDAFIDGIVRDLRLHQFTPERGEVIRAAKGTGLTRPVCELSPRDALVYTAIVKRVEDQLLVSSRKWVGHTRSDKGSSTEASDGPVDSFDWFQFWLRRQGLIADIIGVKGVEFIVESDISNFFPSIRLEHVREHLLAHTRLSKELVRLCMQIIDGVLPRSNYLDYSHLGLPQGNNDSSRAIAHSFLGSVDYEFDPEGLTGRYTRYMDDVLFGVRDEGEGEKVISRLQQSLEGLALTPNSAKTKIVPVNEFLADSMVETNAEIERLESLLKSSGAFAGSTEPEAVHATDLLEHLSATHRALDPKPRRWNRITRRLNTLHRRVGLESWRQHWSTDLANDPSGASVYFEYLRSWPLSSDTVDEIFEIARLYSEIYTNIGILAAETLSSAPTQESAVLRAQVFSGAMKEIDRVAKVLSDSTTRDRICSSWFVVAWKFSNKAGLLDLISLAQRPEFASAKLVRLQAAMLQSAESTGTFNFEPRLSIESSLSLEYLRRLRSGDAAAVGVALNLMAPKQMLAPQRHMIHSRALMLIDLTAVGSRQKVQSYANKALAALEKNESRLRDHQTERILKDWH
ncbi:RNA-directed DNA polymerase [Pseudarthrobacter sp. NPDC080039]|uniref:RNA-directed DNA polymerase n=1 Tax=unclassified Pseudarthrobacter TaxID=2647000 RepID=UPI00344EB900